MTHPTVLIIRDGWGANPYSQWDHANAVHLAKTPTDDALRQAYPIVQIATSGEDVGLPPGVMGNSEVGHQNIGAGRIVNQDVMRITQHIRDGSFFENETLIKAVRHIRATDGRVHLMGLVSDGRVHSDLEHLVALIEMMKRQGLPRQKLQIHAITDGRDTSPRGGIAFLETVEHALEQAGVGRIATLVGRYWAMDRDHRWDRVKRAYDLFTRGRGTHFSTATEALKHYYANPSEPNRQGDEFVDPAVIVDPDHPESGHIRSGDAVVFFNYRGDRPREITKAFVLDDEAWSSIQGGGFSRGPHLENLFFAGMSPYEAGLPIEVVFQKPPKMPAILGQVVAEAGRRQFRCAETEKYPHVTFFFNDYREEPFPGEGRVIVPSPKEVSTYDQKPEMSAPEVIEEVIRRIRSGVYDLIVVNFANGDMVGHTGVLSAAVKAVEVVDAGVGRIVEATLSAGGSLVITADHGNCEQMIDPITGGAHTAHTTYPVEVMIVGESVQGRVLRSGGRLADLAPTLLELMNIPKPPEMTGTSLLAVYED